MTKQIKSKSAVSKAVVAVQPAAPAVKRDWAGSMVDTFASKVNAAVLSAKGKGITVGECVELVKGTSVGVSMCLRSLHARKLVKRHSVTIKDTKRSTFKYVLVPVRKEVV